MATRPKGAQKPTGKKFTEIIYRIGPICLHGAVNFRRLVITVYLALFLGVAVASGVFFWQAQQEYENLREQERAIRQKLADAEQRLKDQERILERLRTDPTYVERVIRQRLGYAKPDEYIFRIRE